MAYDLADYVEVPERLRWFFDKYPDGSLQSTITEWSDERIVVKAYAYRNPTDGRPGMGMASEPYPGKTPYTKDSELMNAETSAWGRALAAVGAPTKSKVASADEVRSAKQRQPKPKPKQEPVPTDVGEHDHLWEPVPGRDGLERCTLCGSGRFLKEQQATLEGDR